jgi:hypothetical protein
MKKVILGVLSLFLISASTLFAQTWTAQTSPVSTDLNGAWACDANVVWMCGPTGVVIRTTNGGSTWSLANTGLTGNDFYTIAAVDANTALAGAGDGGMWRTTNGGTSWTFEALTPTPVFMDVVHLFDANNGFALSDPGAAAGLWHYYITTNAGLTWTAGANAPPNAAGEAGWNGGYAALDTGHIWWGTNATKIWHGGFRGPFTSASSPGAYSFCMGFNDVNTGIAGMVTATPTVLPLAITVNGGTSWAATSFTPINVPYAMKFCPGTGYGWFGTQNIYRSTATGTGTSWTSQLTLSTTTLCYALTMLNLNTGWAGTQAGHIYAYHDVVGIDPNNNSVPKSYNLQQNYPNPFNPTTNIRYSIPTASKVTITIYDALGNEVRTLVNEYKGVGNYVESFDASNLSSGIYFYTLRAGDFVQSKKMSLIK